MRLVCSACGEEWPDGRHCPRDGAPLGDAGDDPLPGTVVGSYRIAALIGAGGMGRVYRAVQPAIGARVAVKVLGRDCTDDPALVERFFAEARAVNLIRHENIVKVLDLARLPDGRPYLVMEFLDGAPLSAVIRRRGPLPLGFLARLVGEVLAALGAAHAAGIVHRDIKPDNLFVTPEGHARVLDFGIAKLAEPLLGGAAPTRTGALLGTPAYMSPEQAAGRKADVRSDLYSLGIVLYEGATGRVPFDATSVYELIVAHLQQAPAPPRALRGDLPAAFETVILRALAKAPDERFPDAVAMARALAAAARGLPEGDGRLADAATDPGGAAVAPTETAPGDAAAPPLRAARSLAAPTGARPGGRRAWVAAVAAVAVLGTAGVLAAVRPWRAPGAAPARDGGAAPAAAAPAAPAAPASAAPAAPARAPLGGAPAPGAALDVHAFLPQADARARAVHPDARLYSIIAAPVRPDGTVVLREMGTVQYAYRSPARSATPPALCMMTVIASRDGVRAYEGDNATCDVPLVEPRCRLAEVWQRALARQASPSVPAHLELAASGRAARAAGIRSAGVWRFSQRGGFNGLIADDCR
ncbi:MAG TPA: serine/threonine-protein kinase [Polyangia bacterium]|jgi:serine/threonine-protein kinase